VNSSFPKNHRLRKRKDFIRVKQNKICKCGSYIKICFTVIRDEKSKLGICAPTRFGNSPERNRFKRLVREVFRLIYDQIPAGYQCIVYPKKKAKEATFSQIKQDFSELITDAPQQ
jgi:ribonuclease P protein component